MVTRVGPEGAFCADFATWWRGVLSVYGGGRTEKGGTEILQLGCCYVGRGLGRTRTAKLSRKERKAQG
jgi:hypothetical protein